jgi:ABC-type uncharacterized transport system auxiliary subunit
VITYRKYIFVIILLLLGINACSEKVMLRRYYLLEYPLAPDSTEFENLLTNKTCEVLTVKVSPVYTQDRIAVRKQSHEVSYYQYHFWAMEPADNITSFLETELATARLFRFVATGRMSDIPDFQIASTVYRLEVVDEDKGLLAHLQMQLEFLSYNSGETILMHTFDRSNVLAERDLNLFAAELSRILDQEIKQFIAKIRTYLETQKSGTAIPPSH